MFLEKGFDLGLPMFPWSLGKADSEPLGEVNGVVNVPG